MMNQSTRIDRYTSDRTETLGRRAVRLARVAAATHMAEVARRGLDPARAPRWSDAPVPPARGPRFAEGAD